MINIETKIFKNTTIDEMHEKQKTFIDNADENTPNQIWLVELKKTITAGLFCDPITQIKPLKELLKNSGSDIILERGARGGFFTYHAPGQVNVVPIINLKKIGFRNRTWTYFLEDVVLDWCKTKLDIKNVGHYRDRVTREIEREKDKHLGCYIKFPKGIRKKFSSIGTGLYGEYTTWGVGINVDMDLTPFTLFNPCNIEQDVANLIDVKKDLTWDFVAESFTNHLIERLNEGYSIKHPE